MSEDSSQREQQNVERDREIQRRAMTDDRFRDDFVRSPKEALEREFGVKVPEGVTILVHEETQDTFHFVLPGRPAAAGSDGDLDDTVGMMRMDDKKSKCCTCGSSTHQTFNI